MSLIDQYTLLHEEESQDYLSLQKYKGKEKVVYVPETCCNKFITTILPESFTEATKTEIIILTDKITYIDEDAFVGIREPILYTPYTKDQINFDHVKNVVVRYGFEKTVIQNHVYYGLFKDKTAYIFDNSLDEWEYFLYPIDGRSDGVDLILMDTIENEYQVIGIEKFSFNNSRSLLRIKMPKHLTYLGAAAFLNCQRLEYIELPDELERIEGLTFGNNFGLKYLIIPHNVKHIDKNAFCGLVRTMIFTKAAEYDSVHEWAFDYIPVKTKFIGFVNHQHVRYAITEDKEAVIMDNTFDDVIEFSIPSHIKVKNIMYEVTEIAPMAFYDSKYLIDVKFPQGIKKIHNYAFSESNIKSLILPQNLEFLGKYVCRKCVFLEKIILIDTLKSIPFQMFEGCVSIKNIKLPKFLETIEEYAFASCKRLSKVEFPSTLKEIHAQAFFDTKVTTKDVDINTKTLVKNVF